MPMTTVKAVVRNSWKREMSVGFCGNQTQGVDHRAQRQGNCGDDQKGDENLQKLAQAVNGVGDAQFQQLV